jgi:hypothetical protein
LLLAPLNPNDDEGSVNRKLRVVGTFIDILIARRAVNYLTLSYSAMSYTIFSNYMKDIRGAAPTDLAAILATKLKELGCDFSGTANGERRGIAGFALNQWSKRYIKQMLARITDHIEQKSAHPSSFAKYVAEGKQRYEVEHIWADHHDRHTDEFSHSTEFAEYRNRIGGLLLLPKNFNASYGDLPYGAKLSHYNSQNLLARSTTSVTNTILGFSSTLRRAVCHSTRILSSRRMTSMRGRNFTRRLPRRYGTRHDWLKWRRNERAVRS